jgi:negative regulator of flagellin synthesis FlgM
MNINSIRNTAAIQKAYGTPAAAKTQAPAAAGPARGTDRLELSGTDHAQMLGKLQANDIRWDKVNAIKAQIANGSYETDDKLDAAADKLLDELA